MKNADAFSEYHPLVELVYFVLVIGFSMFFMHPVCLAVSMICASVYRFRLRGGRSVGGVLKYALPALLLAAAINPLFNHKGDTVLGYFPTGGALTLESVAYGIAAAAMLITVLMWFDCLSTVITTDKTVYLFGRIIPSLSLLITMTLRFVPRFRMKLEEIKEARRGMGMSAPQNSMAKRLRDAFSCFSVMVTWSLENAIDTADSMKSRGYGLRGRTSFSVFKFSARDVAVLVYLALCGAYIAAGSISGGLYWQYFPCMQGNITTPLALSIEVVYLMLCITPMLADGREALKWRYLRQGN